MFKGKSTSELYEQCLKSGFCEHHLKDLEITEEESYEIQRKAFLFLRLQIFGPIVFRRPFCSDKMKTLFLKSNYFVNENDPENGEEFKITVIYLDAIVTFTLCHFCKICCIGSLFKSNKEDFTYISKETSISKILFKKKLDESDIGYLVPQLKENFDGEYENFYKLCYVATLLLVRNVSMSLNLKKVIAQQDKEFTNIPKDCISWNDAGLASFEQKQFEEAIHAYTMGVKYSPYYLPLRKNRSDVYIEIGKYKEAALDSYIVLMIDPYFIGANKSLESSPIHVSLSPEGMKTAGCGIEKLNTQSKSETKIEQSNDAQQIPESQTKYSGIPRSHPKLTEESNDIPELVEASDSETESQENVPDAVDASDSDDSCSNDVPDAVDASDSDESCSKHESPENSEAKEEETVPKSKEMDIMEDKMKILKCALKEASHSLLDGGGLASLRQYREALDKIKAFPQLYEFEEIDILCIKYAFGVAYCKSGGYENLQKAIAIFKDIAELNSHVFPVAYYGIALAYHKLNRFKEALHYLQIIDDILQKGDQIKTYTWPELSVTIEETKKENLETLVKDLLKECENPPPPNATCRFQECSLTPTIYYTDPDFKGFLILQCSDQCLLQFHPICWRYLKTAKHFTDKEFLDQKCITPDCEGVIVKIENIDKDGNVGKVFESADSKKLRKKKSKLEKKLEVKEEKRRKRKDSSSKIDDHKSESPLETANETQTSVQPDSNKNDVKTAIKEKVEDPAIPNEPQITTNDGSFIMFKKEKIVNENTSKVHSKPKEHKKPKNTYSIDEFLEHTDISGNENQPVSSHQQRMNALRQNYEKAVTGHCISNMRASAPKFEPTRVPGFSENEHASYSIEDFPSVSTTAVTTDTNLSDAVGGKALTFGSQVNFPLQFGVECFKKTIYLYLKHLLEEFGPLKEDDPILIDQLQTFPGEANEMIADCGGLGKFLQQSVDFAFVGEMFVCLVDQIPLAYNKISSVQHKFHNSLDLVEESFPYDSHVDSMQYSLNPDAKEYNPVDGKNSPQLMSVISKLRQPLTVDEVAFKEADEAVKIPPAVNGKADSFVPNEERLAKNFAEAYYSAESVFSVDCEQASGVKMVDKGDMAVQTEDMEVVKVSEGTMKIDDELERLKEVVSCLTEENVILKEQNSLLGEQCTSALDSATRCKKNLNIEMMQLKKELEEALAAAEESKKENKSRESKLEKEIKVLSESLKRSKEDQSELKSEMEELKMHNERLKHSIQQLEERVSLTRNEKHIIQTTLELQQDKLKDNIKTLELEKTKSLQRADEAELLLLEARKTEFLRMVDMKSAEGIQKMKELQAGLKSTNLNPVFADNFGALFSHIQNYVSKLSKMRMEFTVQIDEQINAVKNGTPLKSLKPIEVKELPPIPSWSTQAPLQNGASNVQSSLMAQVQMLRNQAAANPYCRQPNTPLLSNFPGMVYTPTSEASASNTGAIPKRNGNSTASASQISAPMSRLPPGIDPFAPLGATTLNKTVQPSVTAKEPASPLRQPLVTQSTSNVSQSTATGLPQQEETSKMQGAVSSANLNAKKASGKADAKTLELDYNLKKDAAAKNAPTSSAPEVTSSKSSASQKNSYEKLIQRLKATLPDATQAQLAAAVKEYRGRKQTLSGITMDVIISEIVQLFEAKRQDEIQVSALAPKASANIPNKGLVNKKLTSYEREAKAFEQQAKVKKCAWGASGDSSKQWSGKDIEESCTICFEEMTHKTAYKVDCGHVFHLKCIKEWLNKKSDCPICRVHLLLPEDYPAL